MIRVKVSFIGLLLIVCSGCSAFYDIKINNYEEMRTLRNVENGAAVQAKIFGCTTDIFSEPFKVYFKDEKVYFSCTHHGSRYIYKIGPDTDKESGNISLSDGQELERYLSTAVPRYFRLCGKNRYCVNGLLPFSDIVMVREGGGGSFYNYIEYIDYTKERAVVNQYYEQLAGKLIFKEDLPLNNKTLSLFFDHDKAKQSLEKVANKEEWTVSSNFLKKMSLSDSDQLKKVSDNKFLELDYKDFFSKAVTIKELTDFIDIYNGTYDPDNLVVKAREKIIPLLRQRGTFDDYCQAFKYSNDPNDFYNARKVMSGEQAAKANGVFAAVYEQELQKADAESIAALKGYIAKYPESSLIAKARDLINGKEGDSAWLAKVSKTDDTNAFSKFISAFPNSSYIEEAKKRIREKELTAAAKRGTAALTAFLQKYPGTAEADKASAILEEAKNKKFAQARKKGIKGLLAYANEADNPAVIQRELDEYVEKNVVVTGSDVVVAPGDGKNAWQWGMESSRDFLNTGDKFNIFIAGTVRNQGKEAVRIHLHPTLHLVRTSTVRLVFSTTKTTPVNLENDFYLELKSNEEKPFLVLYPNISSGVGIGNGMIGGSSSLGFAANKYSIRLSYSIPEITSSILESQQSLLSQFAKDGNVETKRSYGEQLDRFVARLVNVDPDSMCRLHVYYETANPGDGVFTARLYGKNGVMLQEKNTEKGHIGVKTTFDAVGSDKSYVVELMGNKYDVAVKKGTTQFYIYKNRTKTEYERK